MKKLTNFTSIILTFFVFQYLDDTPGIREMNIHGVGKWNRVFKEGSEYCRSIDYDEIYPLFPTPEIPERFEIRKLFPELLLRVPAGVVECTLKGKKYIK
jgi:hypothetical protein